MSQMTWKKESGFIWSLLGSAIGFGNILSFSAQCYKNGGGAFLIPFVVALLVLGVPMLFLEGAIGHRTGLPIVSAYGQVLGRVGKTLGWLMVVAVATIGGFYTVLTGYSVAYAYFSGTNMIPEDTGAFFKQTFLQDSGSLTVWGGFSWGILLVTVLCALFSWFVLARNIRSGIEKVCSIFMPILMALMLFFAIVVCFLPGSGEGFRQYLTPDFSRLADGQLWRDVFGHVFFSFSLGIGIVTAYSRYACSNTSIPKAMWYMALGNFLVSVVAGFAIFGAVGYLSHVSGVPFGEIVKSDSTFEMGFVVFPQILHVFTPWIGSLIGVIFFFAVFIAGITGVFSIAESVAGNLEVEFAYSRKKAVGIASSVMMCLSLFFCMGNGQKILGALAPMLLGNNMLLGGLAEVVVFMYVAKNIQNDAIWFRDKKRTIIYHLVKTVVPLILFLILLAAMASEVSGGFSPSVTLRLCWFGAALLIAGILAQKKTTEYVPSMT